MKPTKQYDYLVVGDSISSYSAAFNLAESGKSVAKLEVVRERVIRGLYFIFPTPFNDKTQTGDAFYTRAQEKCHALGIALLPWFAENIRHSQGHYVVESDRSVIESNNGLIYAPNPGTPLKTPDYISKAKECLGLGLSYCAWSDASFSQQKPVCIIGSGYWAFEQALLCLRHTQNVTIISPSIAFGEGEFRKDVLKSKGVHEIYDNAIIDRVALSEANIIDITFQDTFVEHIMRFHSVFWAPEQECIWDAWDKPPVDNTTNNICFSGCVAGIKLWEHRKQFDHGITASNLLLSLTCASSRRAKGARG